MKFALSLLFSPYPQNQLDARRRRMGSVKCEAKGGWLSVDVEGRMRRVEWKRRRHKHGHCVQETVTAAR